MPSQCDAAWSMQWGPMPWLPPEQHDALGQHPCFFTQHSGVSDARVLLAEDIAYGATITVARIAISANFFMRMFLQVPVLASIRTCFDGRADVAAAEHLAPSLAA